MDNDILVVVLLFLGMLVFAYLATFIDPWLEVRYRKQFRKKWLRGWHNSPDTRLRRYLRSHPADPPSKRQTHYQWIFILLGVVCFVWLVVFTVNMYPDFRGGDNYWFVWYVLVPAVPLGLAVVASGILLPGYARHGNMYTDPVPDIEDDPRIHSWNGR